jgi:hypothetical protein
MSQKTIRRFRELEAENFAAPVVTRADIAKLIEALPDDALPMVAAQLRGLVEFRLGRW